MTKIRYDIERRQSHRGRWKWVWVAKRKGRFATIDKAIRAAKKKNKEEI
jgi:hypothetical protein